MIGFAMHISIVTLWKQKKSKREIAKITGHDRKTVKRIIKSYEETGQELPVLNRKQSILNEYKEQIMELIEQNLTAVRIHEKLSEQGVSTSYSSIHRYISKIKIDDKICVRFHTNGIGLGLSTLITITCPFTHWFTRNSLIMPIWPDLLPNS